MFEPLRFLHVADAGLDQPLADAGRCDAPIQQLLQDATLSAFEQMVATAIEQRIDFVLLAGNTFREADQSLRARLTLLDGLELLSEHKISVFILPGKHDPAWAWRDIPNLPNHVTLLATDESSDDASTPVAMIRDGRVIATIAAGTLHQLAQSRDQVPASAETKAPAPAINGHARTAPFRVGLLTDWPRQSVPSHEQPKQIGEHLSDCPCDYLAVPVSHRTAREQGWHFAAGQTLNTQDGIAHHPGRLQALSAQEVGPHGATLIEVDKAGEIRGTFLPLASVRRLHFEVPIEPDARIEDITQRMKSLLEKESPQECENVWLIHWTLTGFGKTWNTLQSESHEQLLLKSLPTKLPKHKVAVEHRFDFQESQPPLGKEDNRNDLERLYQRALDLIEQETPQLIATSERKTQATIEQLDHSKWCERLVPMLADLDPSRVLAKARTLGTHWLRDADDET